MRISEVGRMREEKQGGEGGRGGRNAVQPRATTAARRGEPEGGTLPRRVSG